MFLDLGARLGVVRGGDPPVAFLFGQRKDGQLVPTFEREIETAQALVGIVGRIGENDDRRLQAFRAMDGHHAHDVAARMHHGGQSLEAAAEAVVMGSLVDLGGPGSGGLVAVDGAGTVVMPFNTEGMYRAAATADGRRMLGIHHDDFFELPGAR